MEKQWIPGRDYPSPKHNMPSRLCLRWRFPGLTLQEVLFVVQVGVMNKVGGAWLRLTHALRNNWTLVPVPPSLQMELQLLKVEMEPGHMQSLALARYLLNVRAPLDAEVHTNSLISVKVQVSPPPISVLTDNILLVGPCHLPKILGHKPLMWLSTSHQWSIVFTVSCLANCANSLLERLRL